MTQAVFLLACGVLFVLPVVFIWCRVYRDGVVGRIALASISFFAAVSLMKCYTSDYEYTVPFEGMAMVSSFALFLLWHLWRFHRRVLRRAKKICPPDCPQDRRNVPDRRFITE